MRWLLILKILSLYQEWIHEIVLSLLAKKQYESKNLSAPTKPSFSVALRICFYILQGAFMAKILLF